MSDDRLDPITHNPAYTDSELERNYRTAIDRYLKPDVMPAPDILAERSREILRDGMMELERDPREESISRGTLLSTMEQARQYLRMYECSLKSRQIEELRNRCLVDPGFRAQMAGWRSDLTEGRPKLYGMNSCSRDQRMARKLNKILRPKSEKKTWWWLKKIIPGL